MSIKRPISKQPIPETAKKVFQGIIFDVYQWQQKMFDGSFSTFEKIKRKDSVTIIPITSEGKIVLAKEQQPGLKPFIGSLGGRIDDGEDPLVAAQRELLEETGMKASKWILWDSCQLFQMVDWAVYLYIAKDVKKVSKQNLDSGEKVELIEMSFDKFIETCADENFRDFDLAFKILKLKENPTEFAKMKALLK